MTHAERLDFIRGIFERRCVPILQRKGHDYAHSAEANNNFVEVAQRIGAQRGIDAIDVLAVYWFKHVMAIETWLDERAVKSEPIEFDARVSGTRGPMSA